MNVLIRTDSSLRIGTGHVMRCLTLADHLRRDGAQVRFVCRGFPGNMVGVIKAQGFAVSELLLRKTAHSLNDVPSPEWQDPEWGIDADETLAVLSDAQRPVDWLIVDSYALSAVWETRMRKIATRIMVIDDLANRPHDCDLLLDQNLNSGMNSRYDKLIPSNCRRLLGPRYALLRSEFQKLRQGPQRRDGRIRRVLAFFGGTDPGNEMAKALHALENLGRSDIAIDVVAGAANPNFDALTALCGRLPQARLHHHVASMAQLMTDADLAIGAPGSTTWERCCLGLPTILISLAMNQESAAQALAKGGYAIYLGKSELVSMGMIGAAMSELLQSPERVRTLSVSCAELVDGRGIDRVLRALDPVPITLRPAQPHHCEQIHQWRNAEETRRHAHDPNPIPWEHHRAWFDGVLHDPLRALLIAERERQPVGVLRYDCESSRGTVSVYLVPGQHGRGYGPRILFAGHEWLKANRAELKSIRAEVLPDNPASAEAFLQAGYHRDGEAYVKHLN